MDDGFHFGLVIQNRSIRHFTVMVVHALADWQYRTGYRTVPQAMAVVLADGSTSPTPVGKVIKISGRVDEDWVVVG